jgi:hypothetical protein
MTAAESNHERELQSIRAMKQRWQFEADARIAVAHARARARAM